MLQGELPYLLLSTLSYNAKSFFEKSALETYSPLNILYLRYIITGIIAFIIFLIFVEKNNYFKYTNLTKEIKYMFLASIASLITAFSYFKLLKKHDSSYIISLFTPLAIIFSVIIDCFI